MPYIKQADRLKFDNSLDIIAKKFTSPGELNYAITSLCEQYVYYMGKNYITLNEAIGALECAKQELYRRVIAPYEDTKCKQNGDVYGTS